MRIPVSSLLAVLVIPAALAIPMPTHAEVVCQQIGITTSCTNRLSTPQADEKSASGTSFSIQHHRNNPYDVEGTALRHGGPLPRPGAPYPADPTQPAFGPTGRPCQQIGTQTFCH